ncbi:hypothetical protein [Candidatus Neptunichlamydia sp. REUL1]|uniref:hypothetical protein n=1 Tax=Candidatus Neptunichlamydia sp. REUL1 TaxID=3064277 RepID=UPI0029317B59|nr:hypothetical protein [Candidatus Neptunochlamydia sp. REUL1]
MESMTRNVMGLTRWITDKSFQALQSLNSSSQKAQEDLKLHGKSVLVKYNEESEGPTAKEIKKIVLAILQPVQTLEVTGVAATIGFYLASKVMPWPISWICNAAIVGSAYFTFQIWQAKDAILEEFFFFEKKGVHKIDKKEFLTHADNLADRVLAKCTLFRLVTSADQTRSFRDMGDIVRNMIDGAKNEQELQKLVSEVSFIGTLFQLVGQAEQERL